MFLVLCFHFVPNNAPDAVLQIRIPNYTLCPYAESPISVNLAVSHCRGVFCSVVHVDPVAR